MKFVPTPLKDAYTIEIEKRGDERGFFGRSFCLQEFEKAGIPFVVKQGNVSRSTKKGTLRGLHFQKAPHQEDKLIRCTKGAIFDVILDLRPESSTYQQWFGAELTDDNHIAMLCPKGFAHGQISLTDNSEITYLVSEFYTPGVESGIRWNDPLFQIEWPLEPTEISEKDKNWPNFTA